VLRTDPVDVDEWSHRLAAALGEYADEHAEAAEAAQVHRQRPVRRRQREHGGRSGGRDARAVATVRLQ
jgi:hypothetical protein